MKELISIIVPIYNVEKYLEECIKSLLNQDYSEIEILLIDDGSPDNCGSICDEYSKKYDNVFTYHKQNGGLSDARNFGVSKAKGKYISFVDSDDLVTKDYISSMYNNLKNNNVDVAACGYCYYYDNGSTKEINYQNIEKKYSTEEAHICLNQFGYFNVASWNKLYKKEIFDDIKFPIGKKSEDWLIMPKIIEKAKGIYYSSDSKYYYRQRTGGITKSTNINTDAIYAAEEALKFYEEHRYKNVIPYAQQALIFSKIGVYNAMLCRNKDISMMKKIKKEVRDDKNNIIFVSLSKARKMQLFLFLNFGMLYDILFKMFDYIRINKSK